MPNLKDVFKEAPAAGGSKFDFDISHDNVGEFIQELSDKKVLKPGTVLTIDLVGPGGGNPNVRVQTKNQQETDALTQILKASGFQDPQEYLET